MTTLLLVHAHPDDECIATGGVMLRAHHDGIRVVLITATRGEEGDIHNMDAEVVRPRLGEVRTEELMRSCAILGVDRQEFLGYRDSGMAGAPSNDDPRAFHAAPLDETAQRVATLMREERPDVVVTYTADGTYWHPDHLKAHRTTLAALDLLRDEGWAPAKLYLHAVPRSAVEGIERRARDAGVELPDRGRTDRRDPRRRDHHRRRCVPVSRREARGVSRASQPVRARQPVLDHRRTDLRSDAWDRAIHPRAWCAGRAATGAQPVRGLAGL